ncbi:hypothetical protein BDV97DRAFT_402026 [Delphinella strobiligena]|nr:hypothetical protein BDV97DRAFT_402026 [Delphinella strobiligena]
MASNDEPRTSIEDLSDIYDTPMTSGDEPNPLNDDDESTASDDEPADLEDCNMEDRESTVSDDSPETSQDHSGFLDEYAQDSEPQEHNIIPAGAPGSTEWRRLIGNIGFGVLQSFVYPERIRNVRKPQFLLTQPLICPPNPTTLTMAQLSTTPLKPSEGLKINFLREPLPRSPGPTTYVPVTSERRAAIQRQRESVFENVNSDTLAQDIALNIRGRSRGDERRQTGQRRAALSAAPANRSLRDVTPALGSPEDKKQKREAQESRETREYRVAREVKDARAARQARDYILAMLVSISQSIEGIKMARHLLDFRPAESSTNGANRETRENNQVRAFLGGLLNNPGVVKRLPRPQMRKNIVSKPPGEKDPPLWRKNAANWSPAKSLVTSTMAPPSRKRSTESSSPTSPTKKFKVAKQLSKDGSVPKLRKQAKKLTAEDVEIEGKYLSNEREGERSARLGRLRDAAQVSQKVSRSTSARHISPEEALQALARMGGGGSVMSDESPAERAERLAVSQTIQLLPQGTLDALAKKVHNPPRGQADLAAVFMEVILGMNVMNIDYSIPDKPPSTAASSTGPSSVRTTSISISSREGAPSPPAGAAADRISFQAGRREQSEKAVSVKALPDPEAIIGFRIEHHRWLQYKLGSHDQTDDGWLYAADLDWRWNVHIQNWQETFPDNYQQLIDMEQYLIEFDTYKDRVVIGMTVEEDRGLNFEVSEAEVEEHLFFDGVELVED